MLVRDTEAKGLALTEAPRISVAIAGIDIGKNSFHGVLKVRLSFLSHWLGRYGRDSALYF
jgi:hypothetical protein